MTNIKSLLAVMFMVIIAASCKKADVQPQQYMVATDNSTATPSNQSSSNSTNGIGSAIPSYYDSAIFTILFVEFSEKAAANLIAHNPGINFIYVFDGGLPPNNIPFISVIDAIPGDGMNPVWREVEIEFNTGFTPHQFYSDDEIEAAASGINPEITLHMTNEVYWCPVLHNH